MRIYKKPLKTSKQSALMKTSYSSSSVSMVNKTPSSTKKHHESHQNRFSYSIFRQASSKIVWICHESFCSKQQHFTLSSPQPHHLSSTKRCWKSPTQELQLHLGCHFQILYARAKKVTWQLIFEVAGWLLWTMDCWAFTRSKFTQKPRVIVSECAHVHEARQLLWYTWKRCEVSSSRNRESHLKKWTCAQ